LWYLPKQEDNCWDECNGGGGKCEWCGQNGYCCSVTSLQLNKDCPSDGVTYIGTQTSATNHLCVAKPVPVEATPCFTINETKSGKTCQKWTSQDPHNHDYVIGDHNNCQNPSGAEGPWCYTTDPNSRWEYCDCGMILNLKPVKVEAA